ncbi:hypothetical protein MKK67_18525 [Methylobacterium sp. J-072]|nr:hypothetical protein [Methylobacterium sp. J-072]MCJ2094470.1 hypothetical protein [Methylobacterium sp. J-072]
MDEKLKAARQELAGVQGGLADARKQLSEQPAPAVPVQPSGAEPKPQ